MTNEINESDLILIIGEINVPNKIRSINLDIKSILSKKKFSKVISTGGIGSKETQEWLESLCKESPSRNLHVVKSHLDESNIYPDKKVIKIGNFNIGLINGYQITPWDDIEELHTLQKAMDTDIIISGFTNRLQIRTFSSGYFINAGSLTGAFSPLHNESNPSFVLMIVEGDVAVLYTYIYNISAKNFDIAKMEINKIKSDE